MDAVMYDSVEVKKLSGGAAGGGAASVLVNGGNALKLAALKQHQQQQLLHYNNNNNNNCGGGGELTEIGAQEISLELQNLIDDSQFGENLFSEILSGQTKLPGLLKAASQDYSQQLNKNNNNANTANLNHPHVVPSPPSSTNSACSSPASPSAYNSRAALAYMPQPVHSGAAYNAESSSVPAIKEEPQDPQDFRPCPGGVPYASPPVGGGYSPAGLPYSSGSSIGSNSNGPTFTTLTSGGGMGSDPTHMHLHQGGLKSGFSQKSLRKHSPSGGSIHGKSVDKSSDEYRRRRERNNIAVRKSREKAKMRSRETEEKVKLLVRENERLQKRIELLSEELNVLRSLFSNVGVLPEHLHREIDKHLQSIQQQHQSLGLG